MDSGNTSSPPRSIALRIAITCFAAALDALMTFAVSQFTVRLMLLRSCFSTLPSIIAIAESGAPIRVKKSSTRSVSLKYSSASDFLVPIFGFIFISSIRLITSRDSA